MLHFRLITLITFGYLLCTTHASPNRMSDVWTMWSDWTRCSTTCGQGVRSRHRECVGYDGQRVFRIDNPTCVGPGQQHATCEDRACAIGSQDIYEHQCSEKDRVKVSGKYHQWTPFTGMDMAERCELACVTSTNSYYNFGAVLDGTPCADPTVDSQFLCVDGTCTMFGCDGVAQSHKILDWCKSCGGDNQECHYVRESFTTRTSEHYGYQLVVKIPAGATYIKITDSSYNYLAISDAADMYLINGDYMVDWPGEFPYAGTMVTYTRNDTAAETIEAEGPTNMDLYVKLIFREYNPGIHYQFFIPKSKVNDIERPESKTTHDTRPMIGPVQPHSKPQPDKEDKAPDRRNENEVVQTGGLDRDVIPDDVVHVVLHAGVDPESRYGNQDHTHNGDGDIVDRDDYQSGRSQEAVKPALSADNDDSHHRSVANGDDVYDDSNDRHLRDDYKPSNEHGRAPVEAIEPYDYPHVFEEALYDSTNYLEDVLKQRREQYTDRHPSTQQPTEHPVDVAPMEHNTGVNPEEYIYDENNYIYNDIYDNYGKEPDPGFRDSDPNNAGVPHKNERPLDDERYIYHDNIPNFNADSREVQYPEEPKVYMDRAQAHLYPNQAFWQNLNPAPERPINHRPDKADHWQQHYDYVEPRDDRREAEASRDAWDDRRDVEVSRDALDEVSRDALDETSRDALDEASRDAWDDRRDAEASRNAWDGYWPAGPSYDAGDYDTIEQVDNALPHERHDYGTADRDPYNNRMDRSREGRIDHVQSPDNSGQVGSAENPYAYGRQSSQVENTHSNGYPDAGDRDLAENDADYWDQLFGVINTDEVDQSERDNSHDNDIQDYLVNPKYNLNNPYNYDPYNNNNNDHVPDGNHGNPLTDRSALPLDPFDPYNPEFESNPHAEREQDQTLHIKNSDNFNYNQPTQNFPGDPYSDSFREHDGAIHGDVHENQGPYPESAPHNEVVDRRVEPVAPPIVTPPPPTVHEHDQLPQPGDNRAHHQPTGDIGNEWEVFEDTNRDYGFETGGGGGYGDFDWSDNYLSGRRGAGSYRWDQYGARCPICERNVPNKHYLCESNYMMRALIDNIDEVRGDTRYEVRVIDSFKSKISLMKREYVWAEGACPCPLLRVDQEYILVGRLISNFATGESRLMLEDNGYITDFKSRHLERFRSILQTIKC